ncbi:hypothetical protein [Flindersiella endophytica]
MPQMDPVEMRRFAGALPHADFSRVNGDLPTLLPSGMEEVQSPNEFLADCSVPMVGFNRDFLHGIEVFRTIAQKAADSFEAVDADHARIMNDLVGDARTDQGSTHTGDLSKLPHTRPLVSPADQPNRPEEPSISRPSSLQLGLAPGLDIDHIPPGIGQGR